jgi:hypothetical protein
MQDTLSKILINLTSGSLLTVLVLYLVLHQRAGMQTQQVIFFKEMWEQRWRHQLLGRMRVGKTVQTPLSLSLGFMPGPKQCRDACSESQVIASLLQQGWQQISLSFVAKSFLLGWNGHIHANLKTARSPERFAGFSLWYWRDPQVGSQCLFPFSTFGNHSASCKAHSPVCQFLVFQWSAWTGGYSGPGTGTKWRKKKNTHQQNLGGDSGTEWSRFLEHLFTYAVSVL